MSDGMKPKITKIDEYLFFKQLLWLLNEDCQWFEENEPEPPAWKRFRCEGVWEDTEEAG